MLKVLLSQDELDSLFLITEKIAGDPRKSLRYIFSEGRYDPETNEYYRSLNFIKNDANLMTPNLYYKSEREFMLYCRGSVEFYNNRLINYENV